MKHLLRHRERLEAWGASSCSKSERRLGSHCDRGARRKSLQNTCCSQKSGAFRSHASCRACNTGARLPCRQNIVHACVLANDTSTDWAITICSPCVLLLCKSIGSCKNFCYMSHEPSQRHSALSPVVTFFINAYSFVVEMPSAHVTKWCVVFRTTAHAQPMGSVNSGSKLGIYRHTIQLICTFTTHLALGQSFHTVIPRASSLRPETLGLEV